MSQTNFSNIAEEYPQLASIGQLAERNANSDPSTSLSKLRLLVEKLTGVIIDFEQVSELAEMTQNDRLRQLDNRGLITINEDYLIRISPAITEIDSPYSFSQFNGKRIALPELHKYYPLQENFEWHRKEKFVF
ncbi:MAG: hypothetical protein ACI8Q1_001086 [Parvicella sp.]|jgi:hypothetical protein